MEVLLSPVIAAIPAEDPDREMSKLHSVYAWGVVGVILISAMYLLWIGETRWQWLVLGFGAIPLTSVCLFVGARVPEMETPERVSGVLRLLRQPGLWLCIVAIFLGGAAECTMAQWASGYLEQALGVPKLVGDLGGVAMFSVMLGLGRTLYSKIGKSIERVLLAGAIGATACYLLAVLTPFPWLGLFACGFTGFCTSMLWPGSLIVASERFPAGGVFVYAMMASGGDLGASVGPQLIGLITDQAILSTALRELSARLGLLPEQLGMKLGMLLAMLFPLCAIPVYAHILKKKQ